MTSGMNKPNGLTVILPEQAESFTENLPIEKFHGIWCVTAIKIQLPLSPSHRLCLQVGCTNCQTMSSLSIRPSTGQPFVRLTNNLNQRELEESWKNQEISAFTSYNRMVADAALFIELVPLRLRDANHCISSFSPKF